MKKLTLLLMISAFIWTASAFPVAIQSEDRINNLEDPAEFELEITNTFSENRTFKPSVADVDKSWWFYDNSFKEIRPGDTETIKFNVNATPRTVSGRHDFTVRVRTNSGEDNITSDYFILEKDREVFFDNINVERSVETLSINSQILNTMNRTLETVVVQIDGPENIEREFNLSVSAGESESFEETVEISDAAGEYSVQMNSNGDSSKQVSFSVNREKDVEKESGISISKNWERDLLTSERSITAINNGSSTSSADISQSFPIFVSPITSVSPEPEESWVSGGKKNVKWTVQLEPGEEKDISYRTSYKIPLAALLVLLVSFVGLKTLEKQPKITKEVKKIEDGVKVTLHVENHSGSPVKRLEVKDFVPSVLETDEFKTNEPVVAKTDNGTRLEWDIEDLQAGESRALIYTLKPDFEGSADVKLPKASMFSQKIGEFESESTTVESVGDR